MKKPVRDYRMNEMDISSALRGWQFQPGQVNVRLIRGKDGKPKLQLRLDLGLLQMELNGRPDGKRPHRSASELEFQTRKLKKHLTRHGNDAGFVLATQDCQALREESAMFYHRYLSLFVLEQYEAVIRDTQHNLDVLDLCRKYGRSEYDRMCLEQYRPYIMMMHTRANACDALRLGYVQTALAYLRGGIKRVLRLVPKAERRKALRSSSEVQVLVDMLQQIRRQLPPDPRKLLQKRLRAALAGERYEEAAELRDQLLAMHAAPGATPGQPEVTTQATQARAASEPKKSDKPARRSKAPRQKPGEGQ